MHMAVDNSRDNKEIFCIEMALSFSQCSTDRSDSTVFYSDVGNLIEMVFVINDPSVVNDEIKYGF